MEVRAKEADDELNDVSSFKVKGSHSTKVQAVVQQLLLIKKDEPDAKCLVFSTVNTVIIC